MNKKINKDKGYTFYMGSRGYGKSVAVKLKYLEDLKQRIKKAIEYIEENKIFYDGLQNEDMEIGLFEDEINELLQILKGEEN